MSSDAAALQLERLTWELARADRKARRRGHPEDWHRLRTTSRRLRGALVTFATAFDHEVGAWVMRRAKRITKLPSRVRDLDVALKNLAVLRAGAMTRDERRAVRDLRRRLERKRYRRERRLQRRLQREEPVAALTAVLRKALRHHVETRSGALVVSPGSLDECGRAVLAARGRLRGWQDVAAVHELRLAVKKYRGALMAIADSHPGGPKLAGALAALQQVQQVLGEHHDWSDLARRLRARAASIRSKGRSPGRGSAYRALRERVEQEQRARFDRFQKELHDRLPALVAAHLPAIRRRAPATRRNGRGAALPAGTVAFSAPPLRGSS